MENISTKTNTKVVTKYPIYIVSKGRWKKALTAMMFKEYNLDFRIVVEPQEYDDYCRALGEEYVIKLPFQNLGVGSFPARNFCWEHSIENGYQKHWVFDDNIWRFRRYFKGKKIPCSPVAAITAMEDFVDRYENVGIGGFNYSYFVIARSSDKKPFYVNTHCYSAMIMKNDMPFRWRLKYNEDVDLCLQVLHNGLCTISMNAFMIDKVSTQQKMEGGNQTELYLGNAHDKKVLKARSLQEIWKDEDYVEVVIRYNRPHHFVDWKKHFKHSLIRKSDLDLTKMEKINNYGMTLRLVQDTKNKNVLDYYEKYSSNE